MDLAQPEPREIRASDTERQRVVATLQAACVEGRLNLDEYGQRVEDALAARTRTQLEALLIDLPVGMEVDIGRGIAPASRAGVSTTVAVLGSAQRNGFWRLAEESRVISVLGSCKIDLRSARISAAVTTLEVGVVLGSVDVIVPAGVEVELEVHAVLGSRDLRVAGTPPAPGAPVVRLTGMVLLGSLSVRDAAAHVDAYG
jgi:hypothetical protein